MLRDFLKVSFFGLRGYYDTTKAWAEHQPTSSNGFRPYVEIHHPQGFHRIPPKTIETKINYRFAGPVLPRETTDTTFVGYVHNGRVYGNRGDVITPDHKFLWDMMNPDGRLQPNEHWLLHHKIRSRPTRLDGLVANISGDCPNNYNHWMIEILPRLELLRLAGVDLRRVDKFLFNQMPYHYNRATLTALGIPLDKVIITMPDAYYECEEMVFPSWIRGSACGIPWIYHFLRKAFLPEKVVSGTPKRLYISRARAQKRNVQNENQVMDLLSRYGFQSYELETLDFFEQVRLFANAEVVIGPHGSGLTNLVFCRPNTKVIEFTMPERVHYWSICCELNLDYYYINSFPELPEDFTDKRWEFNDDMIINLDVLHRTMKYAEIIP